LAAVGVSASVVEKRVSELYAFHRPWRYRVLLQPRYLKEAKTCPIIVGKMSYLVSHLEIDFLDLCFASPLC